MTSILFGFTQDLVFGLGGFSILCWLITNVFHLGKFLKIFLIALWHLEWFFPFQNLLLPWPKWKSPPKSHSPSLCQIKLQIQQVELPHDFSSIYFLSKIFSASYFGSWRFTKELPFLLWVLPPNQFPWLVLRALNQDPWRSTGLQFKYFKLYLLQVWTIFAKFDEIHLNSPPKNLRKFRQPLGALRGHLTKSQLQEKFASH